MNNKEYCPDCRAVKSCAIERAALNMAGAGVSFEQIRSYLTKIYNAECPTLRDVYQKPAEVQKKPTPIQQKRKNVVVFEKGTPYEPSPMMIHNIPPDNMRGMYDEILIDLMAMPENIRTDEKIQEVIDAHVFEEQENPLSMGDANSLFHYEKVGIQLVERGTYTPKMKLELAEIMKDETTVNDEEIK